MRFACILEKDFLFFLLCVRLRLRRDLPVIFHAKNAKEQRGRK
jgi:hypothetical protein